MVEIITSYTPDQETAELFFDGAATYRNQRGGTEGKKTRKNQTYTRTKWSEFWIKGIADIVKF